MVMDCFSSLEIGPHRVRALQIGKNIYGKILKKHIMWYKLPDPIFTMPKRQYKLKIVLNLNYKFSLFEAIIYIFFKFGKSEQKDWFQVDYRFLDVGILVDKIHVKITSQMYFISDINIIL